MKRLLLPLLLVPLTGCVAALPLYMAAGYGYSAYTLYQVYSIGNVKGAQYEIQKQDPTPDALAEIQASKTVAVFPTDSEIDGAVVDIFSERSGLETISSRKTIAYIKQAGISQQTLLSFPSDERMREIQGFGKNVGADLVIFAINTGAKVNTSMLMPGAGNSKIGVNVKLISVQSGEILLEEVHHLKVDVGDAPTNLELAQLSAMGISDRLRELKTGQPVLRASFPQARPTPYMLSP